MRSFNLIKLQLKLSTTATLGTSKKVAIVERLKEEWMDVCHVWAVRRKKKKNGPCREVTVKEETPYTDWNQWGNTTEYWRLLCLPRQICRFSKIAAQSQAISLHELCQQNFLFSVIFKRVRSRSHHQKKFAWLACLHRTPTSNTKWVIKKTMRTSIRTQTTY